MSYLMSTFEVEAFVKKVTNGAVVKTFDEIVASISEDFTPYAEAFKQADERELERVLLTIRHEAKAEDKVVYTEPTDTQLAKFAIDILLVANGQGQMLNSQVSDILGIHMLTGELERIELESVRDNIEEPANLECVLKIVEMIGLREQVATFNAGMLSYGQAILRSEREIMIKSIRQAYTTQHMDVPEEMADLMERFLTDVIFV